MKFSADEIKEEIKKDFDTAWKDDKKFVSRPVFTTVKMEII